MFHAQEKTQANATLQKFFGNKMVEKGLKNSIKSYHKESLMKNDAIGMWHLLSAKGNEYLVKRRGFSTHTKKRAGQ